MKFKLLDIHNMYKTLLTIGFAAFSCALLPSCSTNAPASEHSILSSLDKKDPQYKNPYPAGSWEHFYARKDYPATYSVYRNKQLIAKANSSNSFIRIDLATQRGMLIVDDQYAMDFPCSTGIRAFPTQPGKYSIIGKRANHKSNLYGKIYNAEGKLVNGDADINVDSIPPGGSFVGAPMPYFMRLTNNGLGMHVGRVSRRPVSHGCIRLSRDVASTLFERMSVGTNVEILTKAEPKQMSITAKPAEVKYKAVKVYKPEEPQTPATQQTPAATDAAGGSAPTPAPAAPQAGPAAAEPKQAPAKPEAGAAAQPGSAPAALPVLPSP